MAELMDSGVNEMSKQERCPTVPSRSWRGPASERFDRGYKVLPNGCWQWLGKLRPDGYANLGVDGRTEYAHRYSYMRFRGPIPNGLVIDHLCRNRGCVNPSHLEAVVQRTNCLRGIGPSAKQALQTHCLRGHALTPDNVYYRKDRYLRTCKICSRIRNTEYRRRCGIPEGQPILPEHLRR